MVSPQIRIVVRALEGLAEKLIRKIVLDVVANLLRSPGAGGTPVDTGWARANWIPAIGSPSSRAAPPPGDNTQTRGAASILGGQQQAAVAAIAIGYKLRMGKVTIANNVPYILSLNAGTSKQAPKNFVQRAVIKAVTVDLGKAFGV